MLFSAEIRSGPADFAIFGALLVGVCLALELAVRTSTHFCYLTGITLAAAGGFMLVFINLAVGIIGDEDNPQNLVFFAIPLLGFFGALIGRFKPTPLIRTLIVMAVIQFLTAFMAPVEMTRIMISFTGVFVGLWLVSALLIHRSAHP